MARHQGGCHCGAVRYEAEVDTASAVECNCAHCSKAGLLLAFTPRARFTQTGGADAMTEYRFNTKKLQHLFCATCGIQSFAFGTAPDGTETASINLRTVDGIDLTKVERKPYDGLSK